MNEWYINIEILNALYEGAYILDKERKIKFWNNTAEKITGYKAEEVIGKKCSDNILKHTDKYGNELCLSNCPMMKVLEANQAKEDEVYLRHKSGYRLPVKIKGIPLKFREGSLGVLELFTIVTPFVEEDDDLLNLAFRDSLTKLYNRKGFEFIYPIRQREMELLRYKTGVLFFDIDDFKIVNDKYGHEVGDKILIMVSKSLMNLTRHYDFVVRWGGEEFVLVVFIRENSDLEVIGNKIIRFIKSSFIENQGEIIKVTLSGGGTINIPSRESIYETINRADTLMYQAKKSGKNRFLSDIEQS